MEATDQSDTDKVDWCISRRLLFLAGRIRGGNGPRDIPTPTKSHSDKNASPVLRNTDRFHLLPIKLRGLGNRALHQKFSPSVK